MQMDAQTVTTCQTVLWLRPCSGRTDGHADIVTIKIKSGLGSYHYHCGGYPAHLHTNGVCPYDSGYTAAPAAKTAENAVGQSRKSQRFQSIYTGFLMQDTMQIITAICNRYDERTPFEPFPAIGNEEAGGL